jgi:hypothetical protein
MKRTKPNLRVHSPLRTLQPAELGKVQGGFTSTEHTTLTAFEYLKLELKDVLVSGYSS